MWDVVFVHFSSPAYFDRYQRKWNIDQRFLEIRPNRLDLVMKIVLSGLFNNDQNNQYQVAIGSRSINNLQKIFSISTRTTYESILILVVC